MKLPLIAYLPLALLALIVRFSIEQPQARSASSRPTSLPTEIPSPVTTKPASPPQTNLLQDASDKAVGAAVITQSAQSKYDWDAVAELLQEAITLTKSVPKSSSDYALAQKSLIQYQHNFAYAKQQAIKTAPNPDLIAQTPTHTVSAQQVAQKRASSNISIKPVAQEQLVSIVPSNPPTGVSKLRQVKAVVGQFFAIDARLDVGMHYREYGDRVAELKVALDRLGRQPGATNLPAYTSLRAALTNYETALDTWTSCINKHYCANGSPEVTSTPGSLSPESSDSISSSDTAFLQGQFIPVADADSNWKDKSYLKTTISAIWVAAREHAETAQRQL